MKLLPVSGAMLTLALVVVACSGGGGPSSPSPEAPTDSLAGIESLLPPPLVRGPISPDGLQAILATPDLGVGRHRVGFLLTSDVGFVITPSADLTLRYVGEGDDEVKARLTAKNHIWPFGVRGIYAARFTFDKPGPWALDIAIRDADGVVKRVKLPFEVAQEPSAPAQGSRAIPSATRTLADVASVADLSTGSLHDPDFYRIRLTEAIASGKPTVFVIASPAFCTNATCGPILETLQMVKDKYKAVANFVHADFFHNPSEIQGDLSTAKISRTASEWGVNDAEWTFVIDTSGAVSHKFEGYVTFEELEEALGEVL